jgi:hypothetical protein
METTTPERDDRPTEATRPNPPADDSQLHEVLDLWRDLGGSD